MDTATRQQNGKGEGQKKESAAFKLPRGIRIRTVAGFKNNFRLIVGGKYRESFATHGLAFAAGREVAMQEKEYGREVREFDPREWRRYCEAKRTHWQGAEPDWAALGQLSTRIATKTVKEAVLAYLAARATAKLAKSTLSQMKTKLAALTAAYGDKRLDEVTPGELRAWLTALEGNGFAVWTLRDYLKVVMTFWHWAVREKWTIDNPADAVELPRFIAQSEVNILGPGEAFKLIDANRGRKGFGRLVLEMFLGLRNSSAARLAYSDLDFVSKGVLLPASKHKSGRRHFVDGMPANLWTLLATVPKEDFDSTVRQYAEEKKAAFIRASVPSTHNVLRHTFATMHFAAYKNAALTAILMQHASTVMLYRHYKGRATEAEGHKYFAIT